MVIRGPLYRSCRVYPLIGVDTSVLGVTSIFGDQVGISETVVMKLVRGVESAGEGVIILNSSIARFRGVFNVFSFPLDWRLREI